MQNVQHNLAKVRIRVWVRVRVRITVRVRVRFRSEICKLCMLDFEIVHSAN